MDELLADLYAHQAWADAEHWRAAVALPSVLEEPEWFRCQHHIHLVQRAFLSIVQGREVVGSEPEDFTPESLLDDARRGHEELAACLAEIPARRLDERVELPWFQEPPIRITLRQVLMQAVLHSQHHRGQNAVRLRQLGGEPPTTDLIVWYWKERPAADWSFV